MKKKDAEIKEVETPEGQSMQDRIKELEAKIAAGEEAALARVCKALGVEPEDIEKAEAPKAPKKMIRMFVRNPVNVNGTVYQGDVTVAIDTARVLQQAVGDRQNRLIREMTGNNYILEELQGGGFSPRLVGKIDETGERIG